MSRYQNYSNAKGGAGRNKTRRMKRKLPPGARGSVAPLEARPPMLVMRGLVNDKLETRERIAVEAIVGGWGTTEHYQTLADMQGVMLLAGTTDESRKWARDYAHNVIGPVLCKVRERYQRSQKLTCTTGEREVLRGFVTRYREFWMRQPMELYEAACQALQEHYNKIVAELTPETLARFAFRVRNATLEKCASEFEGQYTDSCPSTNISAAIRAMKENVNV